MYVRTELCEILTERKDVCLLVSGGMEMVKVLFTGLETMVGRPMLQ